MAPCPASHLWFVSVARPMTFAPAQSASCTASEPTPPAVLGREQLQEGAAGLAAIAHSLGYASEFSFAAAFQRHHGVAPGRWRATAPNH